MERVTTADKINHAQTSGCFEPQAPTSKVGLYLLQASNSHSAVLRKGVAFLLDHQPRLYDKHVLSSAARSVKMTLEKYPKTLVHADYSAMGSGRDSIGKVIIEKDSQVLEKVNASVHAFANIVLKRASPEILSPSASLKQLSVNKLTHAQAVDAKQFAMEPSIGHAVDRRLLAHEFIDFANAIKAHGDDAFSALVAAAEGKTNGLSAAHALSFLDAMTAESWRKGGSIEGVYNARLPIHPDSFSRLADAIRARSPIVK
ncbi:hypothetical protein OOJ96_06700 [Pseudomonas sp. 15FMM2]|uniref:Uncharacterized protein n=1 Tax=Pseudomonas imrae TaxID=2992837 RepID=A0ACC7PAQ6_9PSED